MQRYITIICVHVHNNMHTYVHVAIHTYTYVGHDRVPSYNGTYVAV